MPQRPHRPRATPADSRSAEHTSFYRSTWFAALVIIFAGGIAYSNSFSGPFVYDDEPSILSNPTLQSLSQAWSPPNEGITVSGRPVLNFTFALDYALSGTEVWSYHVTNLLIHLTGGLLFFGALRRAFALPNVAPRIAPYSVELALLISLLWTLHPLQTSSVTYVIQRAESLMGVLYLATLWCFLRALNSPRPAVWLAASVVACAAGMGTKEVMVSAPIIVLLFDRTFVAGSFGAALLARKRYYFGLACTWIILAYLVITLGGNRGGSTGGFSSEARWLGYWATQFHALAVYLKLTFFPYPLSFHYAPAWVTGWQEVVPYALIVIPALLGTVYALWRRPKLGFLAFWFFAVLAPTSIIPGTIEMIVEHRMYLALAPLLTLAGVIAFAQFGRNTLFVMGGISLVFALTTLRRNQDYHTRIGLYEDTVAKAPKSARAMALLGDYYRREGQLDKSRSWLEHSLAIEKVAPVLNNLGSVLQEMGDRQKAIAYFEQALALEPRNTAALNNLGNAFLLAGNIPEGLTRLQAAVDSAPESKPTRLNYAHALAQAGRLAEAAAQLDLLVKAFPTDASLRGDYARMLIGQNRFDDAIRELNTGIDLTPNDAELHNRLGLAYARKGQFRDALQHFETAVRLNPADSSFQQNAALAAQKLGR